MLIKIISSSLYDEYNGYTIRAEIIKNVEPSTGKLFGKKEHYYTAYFDDLRDGSMNFIIRFKDVNSVYSFLDEYDDIIDFYDKL